MKKYFGKGTHCSLDPDGDVVEEEEEEYDYISIEQVFKENDEFQMSYIVDDIAKGNIPTPSIYNDLYGNGIGTEEFIYDLIHINNDNEHKKIERLTSEVLTALPTEVSK